MEDVDFIENIVCLEDQKYGDGEMYGYPVKTKEMIFSEPSCHKIVIMSRVHYDEIKKEYLRYVTEDRILPYANYDTRIHFNYSADRYRNWLTTHREEIMFIYNNLADEISKRNFEFILKGAENYSAADLLDFGIYSSTEDPEYFHKFDFFKLTDEETFLDVGAYDGDTVKDFVHAVNGRFESITAVEPDPELFESLNTECGRIEGKIDCLKMGLGDRRCKVRLCVAENKYISELKKDDDGEVDLTTIDSLGEFSLIKISVYGADNRLNIIKGAKNLLKNKKPKIVIQIERQTDDILNVPKEILKYNPEYKIFFRLMIWQQDESFRLNSAFWAV